MRREEEEEHRGGGKPGQSDKREGFRGGKGSERGVWGKRVEWEFRPAYLFSLVASEKL